MHPPAIFSLNSDFYFTRSPGLVTLWPLKLRRSCGKAGAPAGMRKVQQEARSGFCPREYKRIEPEDGASLSRLICGKGNRKGNIVKVTVKVTVEAENILLFPSAASRDSKEAENIATLRLGYKKSLSFCLALDKCLASTKESSLLVGPSAKKIYFLL